jgi:N-acyl-D-amino-acid deacylase
MNGLTQDSKSQDFKSQDFIIRGAKIYDASGTPPFTSDVYVHNGVIAQIAERIENSCKHIIQAEGLALMPGIIDSHTHYDAQITWDPYVRPSPAQGVTTAVIGNCGFTLAPCKPKDRDLTLLNLTQVEGMSINVLRSAVKWGFESFSEYIAQLKRSGCALNIAAYVGHSSIRTFVMGEDATKRAATQQEIAQMCEIVKRAMQDGAIGFASSTSAAHNGEGGKPMPSRLADEQEIKALVDALGECGKGVFMLTKGAQTSLEFLESLAKSSKRPVLVAALLHNSTNPQVAINELDTLAAANQRGQRMWGQVSCCPLTMDFTMMSPYPVEGLQSWKAALGLHGEALKDLLKSKSFRDRVRQELAQPSTFRLFNAEWHKVHVAQAKLPEHAHLEHHSIAELAKQKGIDPLDMMLDLALSEDLETVFVAQLLNSDEEAVGQMLTHPSSLISLSDAGAHLTFFNDTGFGLHLLGHWCRDLKLMTLEQTVKRLTSDQATALGIKGRGFIKEGYAADLLLFDPQTVGRSTKKRMHDLPGGAPRLHTDPLGVKGVWVNGNLVANELGLLENARLGGEIMTEFL